MLADLRDLVDVFLLLVRGPLRLWNRRRQVAPVDDGPAERGDLIADAGNAERRRSHINAAATAAEVERDSDQVNRLHRSLTETDMPSEPGDTTEVNRPGCVAIVSRYGSISDALLTTLCARKTPPR